MPKLMKIGKEIIGESNIVHSKLDTGQNHSPSLRENEIRSIKITTTESTSIIINCL